MKKHSLQLNKVAIWLTIHAGAFILLALLAIFGTRFRINSNLFDIVPSSESSRSISAADKVLSEKNGRTFTILSKNKDFDKAKESAARLYESLKDSDVFEYVNLYADSSSMESLYSFFYDNRYNLQDGEFVELVSSEDGARTYADNALANVYGGFSVLPLDNLEEDPFLLTNNAMQNLLSKLLSSGTAMELKDGVIASEFEDNWYVLLRGVLTKEGASIGSKKSGIKLIYQKAAEEQQTHLLELARSVSNETEVDESENHDLNTSTTEFIFSGIPFHSYESSTSAQTEISLIATISMIVIILLFIIIFKSPIPVLSSVFAIGVSIAFALTCNLLVFKEIHILTFVFGTTLIGTCFDYSIHFFIRWKGEKKLKTGSEITKSIFKGLTLSLLSTEICYIILCFAPFTLLKQVAVFSLTGILSSYLSVVLVFPSLKLPQANRGLGFLERFKGKLFTRVAERFSKKQEVSKTAYDGFSKKFSRKLLVLFGIVVLSCVAILVFHKNIRVENNLSKFYSMKGKTLQDEIVSAKVLNHGSSGWYFIVRGETEAQLLENEERFCELLNAEIENGNLSSFTAVTQYIPSPKKQRLSYEACKNLLNLEIEQMAALGLESTNASEVGEVVATAPSANSFESSYSASKNQVVYPDKGIPEYIQQSISSLWIGEIDGQWYSAVLPLHTKNSEVFKTLADSTENVFFVNKMQDIGKELDNLTKLMLILLGIVILVLIPILKIFYNWKNTFKIICLPVLITLVTVAVLGMCNVQLGFFTITGLILVFGLGMDYIIYTLESSTRDRKIEDMDDVQKLNRVAVALSFITTALSFGALALSSFFPVQVFGLTVFAGITTAFVCAPLLDF